MTTSGAQNRLIGGRRASRRANMELFLKVISQAFLLCTRIDIFEKNVFWSQVKSWFVSMFSFETAQSITFWAAFLIFDDFSIILDYSASWFQKISFENIIFAIHVTTFNRFGPYFSRWFEAWGPPRFTFEILSANKIASEIALHESCKYHEKLPFLTRICRWLSDFTMKSELFWILASTVYRTGAGWKRIVASYCKCVLEKLHLQ